MDDLKAVDTWTLHVKDVTSGMYCNENRLVQPECTVLGLIYQGDLPSYLHFRDSDGDGERARLHESGDVSNPSRDLFNLLKFTA